MKPQDTDSLGFLIHDVARLMRRRFELRGSEYGLSAAQWRVIFRVAKDEGLAQARLAELLEIEPISVSRLLDRMEDAGWIERRPGAEDRRVRAVFLSARSQSIYGRIRGMAHEVYGEALAGMSDIEKAALISALQTMAANLSEAQASGLEGAAADDEKATTA